LQPKFTDDELFSYQIVVFRKKEKMIIKNFLSTQIQHLNKTPFDDHIEINNRTLQSGIK